MDLRQLRYFVTVAKHLHFGKAAAELNMAQPPLSHQVLRLEDELGVRLFERTSRKVAITAEGAELLEATRCALHEIGRIRELAARLRVGEAGRLRVGFVFPILGWGLAERLRTFRDRYPAIDVEAVQLPNFMQTTEVLSDRIDVGLTMSHVHHDDVTEHELVRLPLMAVLPVGHRLAGSSCVRLCDLAEETFIAFQTPPEAVEHDYIMRACAAAGFIPRVNRQGAQVQTIVHMVAAGFGVSLVTDDKPAPMVDGTVVLPLETPAPHVALSVIHHRDRLRPTAERLVRHFLAKRRPPPRPDAELRDATAVAQERTRAERGVTSLDAVNRSRPV